MPSFNMNWNLSSIIILLFTWYVTPITSFAAWMETDYCDVQLQIGEIVMNSPITFSPDRQVVIKRKNGDNEMIEVLPNTTYISGEELIVSISQKLRESIIFESVGGLFSPGGCSNRRTTKDNSILKMPTDGSPVSVWVGWASGYQQVGCVPPPPPPTIPLLLSFLQDFIISLNSFFLKITITCVVGV